MKNMRSLIFTKSLTERKKKKEERRTKKDLDSPQAFEANNNSWSNFRQNWKLFSSAEYR